MPQRELARETCLERVQEHLEKERYCRAKLSRYPPAIGRFLDHLEAQGLALSSVEREHVDRYIAQLGCGPQGGHPAAHRAVNRAAIHMLLKLTRKRWPPESAPQGEHDVRRAELLDDFEDWMSEVEHWPPAASTRERYRAEAQRLLSWLEREGRGSPSTVRESDLHAYLQERNSALAPNGQAVVIAQIKSFLRYLKSSGTAPTDLSSMLPEPRYFRGNRTPSALKHAAARTAFQRSAESSSRLGLRDHAICALLANDRLSPAQIVALRLEDLDLRDRRLRVRGSRAEPFEIPLLRESTRALAKYLRGGRPETLVAEVFVTTYAPYRPLGNWTIHETLERWLRPGAYAARLKRKSAQRNSVPKMRAMSGWELFRERRLSQFREHLEKKRYYRNVVSAYVTASRRFLDHLDARGLDVTTVPSHDVERYLMELGRGPRGGDSVLYRQMTRAAIHTLLKAMRQLPPLEMPVRTLAASSPDDGSAKGVHVSLPRAPHCLS